MNVQYMKTSTLFAEVKLIILSQENESDMCIHLQAIHIIMHAQYYIWL